MDIKKIHVGDTYYIVTNSTSGPKMQKVTVKTVFAKMQSVIVVDENGREIKKYQNSLKDLLSHEEALEKYETLQNNGPFKPVQNNPLLTRCWNCGISIHRRLAKTCNNCKWNICPSCGSCQCNYRKRNY